MEAIIARPAVGATRAQKPRKAVVHSAPPASSPAQISEADSLTLKAVNFAMAVLANTLYDGSEKIEDLPRMEEAYRLLGRLVDPESFPAAESDPESSNLGKFLILASSELEACVDEIGARGHESGHNFFLLSNAAAAQDVLYRTFIARQDLPGSIAALRALATVAGANPLQQPLPPTSQQKQAPLTDAQKRSAMTAICAHVSQAEAIVYTAAENIGEDHTWGLVRLMEWLSRKLQESNAKDDLGTFALGAFPDASTDILTTLALLRLVNESEQDQMLHAAATLLQVANDAANHTVGAMQAAAKSASGGRT